MTKTTVRAHPATGGAHWITRIVLAALAILGMAHPASGGATTVTYAGFAYAGDAQDIAARFKWSKRYEERLRRQGTSIDTRLRQAVQVVQCPFDLNMQGNAQMQGAETLVTALAVTGEVISDETFGQVHKLLIQIRAQAMIFDFQSRMLLRAHPLSFAYLDTLDHPASEEEIDDRVAKAYEGAEGKAGVLGRYADALSRASLPRNDGLFLQITEVTIGPDSGPGIPRSLSEHPGAAQAWIADQLDEALVSHAGVPVIPYSAGHAVGNVMQLQLTGSDFSLRFPEPNVEVSVELSGVRRVQYAQNAVGTSYIYGAFGSFRIAVRDAARPVLDARFRNGEVKEVPATQQYLDDLPAYGDAVRGLFNKVADELGGRDTPWLRSATTTPGIKAQLAAARGLLQKCR